MFGSALSWVLDDSLGTRRPWGGGCRRPGVCDGGAGPRSRNQSPCVLYGSDGLRAQGPAEGVGPFCSLSLCGPVGGGGPEADLSCPLPLSLVYLQGPQCLAFLLRALGGWACFVCLMTHLSRGFSFLLGGSDLPLGEQNLAKLRFEDDSHMEARFVMGIDLRSVCFSSPAYSSDAGASSAWRFRRRRRAHARPPPTRLGRGTARAPTRGSRETVLQWDLFFSVAGARHYRDLFSGGRMDGGVLCMG